MTDTESAPAAEGEAEVTEGAEGEAAEGEAAEPEKEPTPPIELNLPPEVAEALTAVMGALETFGKTVQPFLDESHANAAEAAAAAEPLIMPEGLAKIEEVIGEWSTKVQGHTEPFKTYLARIERERQPIDEYLAKLKDVFKDAQPPPPPPEPAEEAAG
jgi:hypothetical protein